ncbi:hypothetical protein [Tropicimonas marinistellae]|uniref:hypothetical protein n=1 Tax=Tropicimonas marinistellae TaxID=1739787 RepID=UPI00082BC76C|nr:hypothetical protein [Tropicimonas marinistellae]
MTDFLPRAVLDELELARKRSQRNRSRMTVCADGREYVTLRHWDGGFSLKVETSPRLRGLVDLYSDGQHFCQALIVTSSESGGERVFEVKRATPAVRRAPAADFVRERPEPAGLLTKR